MKTFIATFEVKVKYVVTSDDEARDHALAHKFFLDSIWAGRTGNGHAKTVCTKLTSIDPENKEADHV